MDLATTQYSLAQGSISDDYGTLEHSILWPNPAVRAWAERLRVLEVLLLIPRPHLKMCLEPVCIAGISAYRR